jgi:hypothetical protein
MQQEIIQCIHQEEESHNKQREMKKESGCVKLNTTCRNLPSPPSPCMRDKSLGKTSFRKKGNQKMAEISATKLGIFSSFNVQTCRPVHNNILNGTKALIWLQKVKQSSIYYIHYISLLCRNTRDADELHARLQT